MPIVGSNFNDFKRKVQRAHAAVPKIAAVEAERHFGKAFQKEAWEGKKWPSRKKESSGVGRKNRRGLLVQSGRLRRGFQRGFASGKHAVVIINATLYAEVHNEGLRVRGIQHVRAHARRGNSGRQQVKGHTRKVDFKMPKRQFMGNSNRLNGIIRMKIIRNYRKIL